MSYNCIFLIGPTAVGKTAIGVRLARALSGEIISADSRQVYKGLDIGSGKDLSDYNFGGEHIPYHLIDVCTLEKEYNLFDFQEGFYESFGIISERGKLPVCVGGTGMYVDSILRKYDMIPVPENKEMKAELFKKELPELERILIEEKEKIHNTTEFGDKERVIKAIIINRFNKSDECRKIRQSLNRPKICPLVIGTTLERSLVRERIVKRLKDRMEEGMIEEVRSLHEKGASWERLESLGLEYRFVSEFLQGKIGSMEKLIELLGLAIGQFAKRQETWFRGMEKKGVKIHWLPKEPDIEARFRAALELCERERAAE